MAEILRHMVKFRYWKLTAEEMEKVTHDDNKVLNWDIKCTKEPEEDAVFFGIFLYKAGTPHDYDQRKVWHTIITISREMSYQVLQNF